MSYLNELQSATPRKMKKRVGRGIGSGCGKTAGRGHKGQKSRSGGFHKIGFEGGQMPIQRRVPKYGFTSRKALLREEIRLQDLSDFQGEFVTVASLRDAGCIRHNTKYVKIFLKGEITSSIKVKGIAVTKAAKAAIEAAGGSVE